MPELLRTEWLAPSNPTWAAMLESLDHDIYATPRFAAVAARSQGGVCVAWAATEHSGRPVALLPLVERVIPGSTLRDAVSPYGYPGFPRRPGVPVGELLERFDSDARHRGLVSTFLRPNPILDRPLIADPPDLLWASPPRPTVAIDLTSGRSSDEVLSKTSRYELRRAAREGVTIDHIRDSDAAWERFQAIYAAAMDERGARGELRFGERYFAYLREETCFRLYVARLDGEVIAAATFSFGASISQYHLAADDGTRRSFSPMRSLIWRAATDARNEGLRWLHLGGGLSSHDTRLLEFKRSMSDTFLSFRGLGVTHLLSPRAATTANDCPYFPHYRCELHGDDG